MSYLELISVIVPVYKVEAYLDRCVQSIVDQTYTHLEIILVDDGSPDRCPQMCDDWAKRDSRIRVIHQENAGAGAARNAGMATAQGQILAFMDSDDVLHPQMYAHLMDHMDQDTDIVECDYFLTDSVSPDFPSRSPEESVTVYPPVEALSHHIADRIFRQTIWNKLYRKHTVHSVLFPTGKLIDDEFWTYKVLGNAKKLKHSTRKLYAYMQQSGSVMHMSYSLRRLQAVEAKMLRMKYIWEYFPQLFSQAAANLWGTCVYHGQMSLRYLASEQQRQAFSRLRDCLASIPGHAVLKSDLSFLYRIWYLLSKLSFRGTCRLRNLLRIGL